jgi:putative Mn2+ efflux pump MntP
VSWRHTFRLAFHFGLFQFVMPVLGWLAGEQLAAKIGAYDHWVAFGLLTYVAAKMLWESRRSRRPEMSSDPTRGLTLVALSVATSIDALAVGVSLALVRISIWVPAAVIGVVAAALSAVGIALGSRLKSNLGRAAQVAGGCILLLIAVRIVVLHVG